MSSTKLRTISENQKDALDLIIHDPAEIGRRYGFTDLTDLHNGWIREMLLGTDDATIQAHRGSYKTSCLSVAISLTMILFPKKSIMVYRKTDTDVSEVIRQVGKILQDRWINGLSTMIYGVPVKITEMSDGKISTAFYNTPRGASQLSGLGIKSSMTGKHADLIITDDIVNMQDRISKAERERTKLAYMELQNIRNRGGRILNTGTPWHREDAFTLMPNIQRYDCYRTGIIESDKLQDIKDSMTKSLFAANYELKHIADEDVIFSEPQYTDDSSLVEDGDAHIDAAYGGGDGTSFTVCCKRGDTYYIFGKVWKKHVDDCMDQCIEYRKKFRAGKIYCENNGDKGYLAKAMRQKGERVISYHEDMNKFVKITSYLKAAWKNVVFISGTDAEYINEILDYNENAEHDDCPDSAASIIRQMFFRKDEGSYISPFGG